MKKKRNFTLTEVVIVVIVAGILATFAIPAYKNLSENAKSKVCQTNLQVLLGAVEAYAFENDELPGSLSYLNKEHIDKALAQILKKEGAWKIQLAYFIVNLNQRNLAFAQGYWEEAIALRCPADGNPRTPSYEYAEERFSSNFSLTEFQNLSEGTKVIQDSDFWHKRYRSGSVVKYRQYIDREGNIGEDKSSLEGIGGSGNGAGFGCRRR